MSSVPLGVSGMRSWRPLAHIVHVRSLCGSPHQHLRQMGLAAQSADDSHRLLRGLSGDGTAPERNVDRPLDVDHLLGNVVIRSSPRPAPSAPSCRPRRRWRSQTDTSSTRRATICPAAPRLARSRKTDCAPAPPAIAWQRHRWIDTGIDKSLLCAMI